MKSDIPWQEILEIARNAPSGGNSQPWSVRVNGDNVCIGFNHEIDAHTDSFIYINALFSIGAIAQNIQVLANALGFTTVTDIKSDGPDWVTIRITNSNSNVRDEATIQAVKDRCTNRKPTVHIIPEAVLSALENKVETFIKDQQYPPFKLARTQNREKIIILSKLLADAEQRRFSNQKLKDHFFREIKCHENDGDKGIALNTLELPFLLEKLLCLMIHFKPLRKILSPKLVRAIIKQQLAKSSDIACFFGEPEINARQLIQLGSCVQFFWIELTKQGYAMQPWMSLSFFYLDDKVQRPLLFSDQERNRIEQLSSQFCQVLGEGAMAPLFIFRLHDGAKPQYRSLKQPI